MPQLKMDYVKCLPVCALALIGAFSARLAHATLGEPEASVQTDVAQFHGSVKIMNIVSGYRVHEIQLPSGTLMREFVAPDGKVFAVAWSGPFAPDLRQAFGKYFDVYVAAAKIGHTDRNHLSIQQTDLVVDARGHARGFSGRAYLPSAVPAGVDVGDLK